MRSLDEMRIAPDGAALTFEKRLAREQGWRPAFAEAVMEEYRRFLYLAATGDAPVTPSEAVDAAWHLHLTYTRHYWEELCGRIIRRPLHHQPTEGGAAERRRYRDQYARTLARYEGVFGAPPPRDIWPAPQRRFAPARPRIDLRAVAATSTLLLAACATLAANAGGASEDGDGDLWIIPVVLGVLALIFVFHLARGGRRKGRSGDSGCGGGFDSDSSHDGSSDSGCGGGCGGGD